MSLEQKIREIFVDEEYKQLSKEDYTRLKKRVLAIVNTAAGELAEILNRPRVYTLCDACNKEFRIKFEEPVPNYTACFARCPHCNHSNKRWLRIPKEKKVGEVIEGDPEK